MKINVKKLAIWGVAGGAFAVAAPLAIGAVIAALGIAMALSVAPPSILFLPLVAYVLSAFLHRKDFVFEKRSMFIPSTFNRMSEKAELWSFVGLLVGTVAMIASHKTDLQDFTSMISSAMNGGSVAGALSFGFLMNAATVVAAFILGGCRPRILTRRVKAHISSSIGATPENFGEKMIERIDAEYQASDNKLLAGDLEGHSREIYPFEKYPELYQDMPEDVRRPIIQDGRLITGELLIRLVPRRLEVNTIKHLYDSMLDRFAPAMFAGFVSAAIVAASVLSITNSLFGMGADAVMKGVPGSAEAVKMTPAQVPLYLQDAWSVEEATAAAESFNEGSIFDSILAMAGDALMFAMHAAGGAIFFVSAFGLMSAGIYLFFMKKILSPSNINSGIDAVLQEEKELRKESVESVVRWKKRLETRANDARGYRKQIGFAIGDKSPLITVGKATGTMLFRGALNGYMPGQDVRLSLNDTHQNIMLLGGTGSGKSFSVICPIMSQVIKAAIENRAVTDEGKKVTQALYVTDGKGVLWMDAVSIAKKYNVECRVIGCGPTEFGVDLFGGLDPQVVASALNNCMSQIGGGGGNDPFWMQMACQIIEASTKIARVWEITEGGYEYVDRTGERIYSPVGVYALARSIRDPNGLVFKAVQDIMDQVESDPDAISALLTPDLWSAIEFLRRDMINYPEETVGSFLSNVANILAGFTNLFELRSQFGGAGSPRTLDIDRVWDDKTVTAVNLSPAEWGDAGRMVNIFVKIRLYHRARMRQLKDNDIGKKAKLMIVMDEAQDLVTTGAGGYSETSFLNYSRSTGCSFLMGTQTLAALYAALGEGNDGQKTKNLTDQFRTKIFLAAEGKETINYMKELAGKALRSNVGDYNQHETFVSQKMEAGRFDSDFDLVDPFDLTKEEAYNLVLNGVSSRRIQIEGSPLVDTAEDMKAFVRVNYSGGGISSAMLGGMTGNGPSSPGPIDWVEKEKSVIWRAEDKRKEMMAGNKAEEDLIHDEDLMTFGRGQAYIYVQRAGNVKQDIIELDPTRF